MPPPRYLAIRDDSDDGDDIRCITGPFDLDEPDDKRRMGEVAGAAQRHGYKAWVVDLFDPELAISAMVADPDETFRLPGDNDDERGSS